MMVTARSPISVAAATAIARSVLAFKRAGHTVRPWGSAASTSSPLRPAVPHYFFSQIDDKLSRLPGRLAVSVHRKTPPLRTQQGMHIVLKEFSTALAASRHRSKRVLLSKRLKQR